MDTLVRRLALLLVSNFVADCLDIIDVVEVQTPSGWVRGYDDNGVFRFVKIPFAEPPVGKLRFQKPKPIQPWSDVKGISKSTGPNCMQPIFPGMEMDPADLMEDCLYLNIYVPGKISKDSKLSILVWIHGGAFIRGSGSHYDPLKLSQNGDVIVVTINYRLGLFGFLTLHDPIAAGNYGLWDQIEALRWIQENIQSFGGNPESVTIFGQSVGGMSVHLLSLIPSNKGMFQRVIAMSGVTSPLILGEKRFEKRVVQNLSEKLGCDLNQGNLMFLKCMQTLPAEDILSSVSLMEFRRNDNFTIKTGVMCPTIDGELFKRNPLIQLKDKSSEVFLFHQSLDFIFGTTDAEGSLLSGFLMPDFQSNFNFNVSDGIPLRVLCEALAPAYVEFIAGNFPKFTDAICKFYTIKDDKDTQSNKICSMYADILMVVPTADALLLHSQNNPSSVTYHYVFSKPSPAPYFKQPSWFRGAGHTDELYLLFNTTYGSVHEIMYDALHQLSDNVIQYWSNFAKFGNPNGANLPEWPSYDVISKHFLDINTPITVGAKYSEDTVELYTKYMRLHGKRMSKDEL